MHCGAYRHQHGVPSLLGWDLLGHWRIDCDRALDRLQFTVHSADFTVVP